ncbi:MAG: twin-arginine translocase TatA/TatE family subunit, partial [Gemmatimonadetes bacterium]|nr:twin-arginine translocase TatA/TatE family subunit [Gemmatimonadota bacterium]
MFGSLGMWEVLVILFIVLLLFGARRLPEIGGSLGKG